MVTLCAFCKTIFKQDHYQEEFGDGTSHGCCDDCLEIQKQKLKNKSNTEPNRAP